MNCKICEKTISKGRIALGYIVCLSCGEIEAQKEIALKKKRNAPAYNKGPYMYINSIEELSSLGRKI